MTAENNEFIKLITTLYSKDYCKEEWVYVEYLRRLLKISPFEMCRVLNEGKFYFESNEIVYIETNYADASQGKYDYFTTEILDDVKIHTSTWRNFLKIFGYNYFTPIDCNPNTASKLEGAVLTFEPEFEGSLFEAQDPPSQGYQTSALERTTPVNAARWEASCRAACTLLVEIMEKPQETGIIKKDFFDMISKQYTGLGTVHSKVEEIAWAALPTSKKNGAGCPKKNPKNN